jgi:hypothetical protein
LKESKLKDVLILKIVSWAIALSVVGVVGLYVVGGPQAFKNPTVREILAAADDVNPLEDMVGLCSKHRCAEGWRTDVGNFVRFERLGQAEYWSTVLGDDCRRVGRILVDFTDMNLTTEQKQRAVDIIFQGKDWF